MGQMTNFVGFCFMKEGEEQGNPFVLDMLSVRVKIISIRVSFEVLIKKIGARQSQALCERSLNSIIRMFG